MLINDQNNINNSIETSETTPLTDVDTAPRKRHRAVDLTAQRSSL